MDEKQRKRLLYKRNWISAKRSFKVKRSLKTDKNNSEGTDDYDQRLETSCVDELFEAEHGMFEAGHETFEAEHGMFEAGHGTFEAGHGTFEAGHGKFEDEQRQGISDASEFDMDDDLILSSESEGESNSSQLSEHLVEWINNHQIKHSAADDLLKILRLHGHPSLPCTARTLLQTERGVHTEFRSGMEYAYLGLTDKIKKNFEKYPDEIRKSINVLEISFNIDGVPLFSSSATSLWPILCAFSIEPVRVFPVALLIGKSKPNNLDFLTDTVNELNILLNEGLSVDDRIVPVHLKCVICDAPAKAMIKGIKQFSGYYGCDRCSQRGVWLGRVTYQEIENLELRTDESFRNQTQEEHHRIESPLCQLPMDMVKQVPIDYMHQCCLGVMKRLLLLWLRGTKEVRMSALQQDAISRKLLEIKKFIPDVFARKPRGLSEIDRWKASEYRQFLLYTGSIVLRGTLQQSLYEHFMTFSVAMRVLSSPSLVETHLNYAHDLLVYFVKEGRELYGPEFLVYNVHSLLHLSADVKEFGCLDSFSAFSFENYMQQLKRMVRSGRKPLVQLIKRLGELENYKTARTLRNLQISCKNPNNAYILGNRCCCEVDEVSNEVDDDGNNMLLCRVYEKAEPLFIHPCDSQLTGIFRTCSRNVRMKMVSPRDLTERAMMIVQDEGRKAIFLAVLHEL